VQPFGCVYRFTPDEPFGGRGSLHAGGVLEALSVPVTGDLSVIDEVGTVLPARWVRVPNANPLGSEQPIRQQAFGMGATLIAKAEGIWLGSDGNIWFTSSFARTPASAIAHGGQIWRYDPVAEELTLMFAFAPGSPFDGPDNVVASPYGFALACTDGTTENWLLTLGDDGSVAPFALNRLSDSELAGATFSPDGQTLFANIYAPGMTLAITGPWESGLG
jgi:secreted PhoX family phosphatase